MRTHLSIKFVSCLWADFGTWLFVHQAGWYYFGSLHNAVFDSGVVFTQCANRDSLSGKEQNQ
jgi:hypothetical protein